MQLAKSNHIIESLAEFDDFFKTSGTECWQAPSGNINLYLFSTVYETVKELQEQYKVLRDHVAISFQSRTLNNAAERWNLYILYLVKEQVPQDIKQVILQDKFSARKMVCSTGQNIINDDYINEQVTKTLLDIEIPQKEVVTDQLQELITALHPQVADAVRDIGIMNNRDNIQNLIKTLSDE